MSIWYFPIVLLIAGLAGSYWFGYTPILVAVVYGLASVISYWLYARDKRAAESGMWRVSERILHASALLGGWPGAIVGQQKLRHKTRKTSFRKAFYVTLLVNVAALGWLHTATGSDKFHASIYNMEYWLADRYGGNAGVVLILKLTRFHQVQGNRP